MIENQKEIPKNDDNNIICLLYKIPGLYNLYQEIYSYLRDNIKNDFYENEKKFRFSLPKTKEDLKKLKKNFHENEQIYLDKSYDYLKANDLFIMIKQEQESNDEEIFKKFLELLFKDYLTFYLFRKNNNKENNGDYLHFEDNIKVNYNPDDIEHKLILKLIDIRFKIDKEKEEDIEIIKNNKNDYLKILLIKIIWIESNYDYIINLLKIYDILSFFFPETKNDNLYNNVIEFIDKGKVRYIAQEKRNPEHTTELNECFYIILASLCQCITNEDSLKNLVSDKIYNYIEKNEIALSIITKISDDLLLSLNEKNIIEEYLLIIEVANRDEIKDIEFSKNVLMKLKQLSNIIQTKDDNYIEELISSFNSVLSFIIFYKRVIQKWG